jgi:hypothetical protein
MDEDENCSEHIINSIILSHYINLLCKSHFFKKDDYFFKKMR